MTAPCHDAARAYAQAGISVIPLAARSKRPLIDWKPFQDYLAPLDLVDRWFAAWPHAHLGIVTGYISRIVVLDVDGPTGLASLKPYTLPRTRIAMTGNGMHYLFAHPGGDAVIPNFAHCLEGLDIRGDGGYIVAPPSIHPSGKVYRWIDTS